MALATNALPFGLRDVKLYALDAVGESPGAAVDLPASRTFSFAEAEDFEELRGDDIVQASHGAGPVVNWTIESGGISLDAYKLMAGGTVSSTGVTPNIVKTYAKKGTDARPYFQVKGQVISDSGGDLWAVVYKAKSDGDIGGEFTDGSFFLTGADGKGYPNAADKLYDFVQHETATTIT
jgi:hypothetical protein